TNETIRAVTIEAKQELPQQPVAATLHEVITTLDNEHSEDVAAAITLAWWTCARVGCILQLELSDIQLTESLVLTVRFRRGKSVRTRGPYTVHSGTLPENIGARLRQWLRSASPQPFRSCTGSDVRRSLRMTNPALEQRSLSRGALQTLAAAPGVTDALLMEFSGHTRVSTLRRYLSWGTAARHLQTDMENVASILGGEAPVSAGEQLDHNRPRPRPHTPGEPRFLRFLGMEAPPISEFIRRPRQQLPLHAKPVTASVNRDHLLALPGPAAQRAALQHELQWLHNEEWYLAIVSRLRRSTHPLRRHRCTLTNPSITRPVRGGFTRRCKFRKCVYTNRSRKGPPPTFTGTTPQRRHGPETFTSIHLPQYQ
ncbi:TATE DNA transposon, putative, partial [Bodo saltans]